MARVQFVMDSKIGPLHLVASERGLQGVFWKPQNAPVVADLKGHAPALKHMRQAAAELAEYFAGRRKTFELEVDVAGTAFQEKVWRELRKIPYGQTVSYKDIALRVGTQGIRAVGTANGRNPLSIIVPCHRVIASGGGLGGYAGGLEIKKRLLALEQGRSL